MSTSADSTGHSRASRLGPRDLAKLSLGALGIVYGDIGTSPLYAFRDCFHGPYGMPHTPNNILGILSLIFWSISLIVVFKYLTFLMRANNHGEGGTMALIALIKPIVSSPRGNWFVLIGLFGASLLYGEGMITPAISVLSAVEGLEVATPVFKPFIVPITLAVLVALFVAQKRGTAKIGAIFGPAMIIWFGAIAAIAIPWIVRNPVVWNALSPLYAARFFAANGLHGFLVLSAVVLCITGAEALYADMGHFGVSPIRRAWYWVVFPSLIINYFGQGALLLSQGESALGNPFFALVPPAFLYPMVGIATLAAVIASQALISGAFSLTQQATQLGFLPRFPVVHTSEEAEGQIYIARINQILLIACIALVLSFRHSSQLSAAYGIAVTVTMTITSILFWVVARRLWKWSWPAATGLVAIFLTVDVTFLLSNVAKILHGGWVPVVIAGLIFTVMTTWRRGRALLSTSMASTAMPITEFMAQVERDQTHRVQGTAVFMTPNVDIAPSVLRHHYKHNRILHERVILLTIGVKHVPSVPLFEHARVTDLGLGFIQIKALYGYMQSPSVDEILRISQIPNLTSEHEDVSFYLGRETLLVSGRTPMMRWRKKIFAFLSRNAQPATAFFAIPPDRVVEVGLQLEI